MPHPGHTQIPNTEVIDENGKAYRFYDDLVKDRVVMINFFFQSCGGTCPLTTQNLR
jgi:protein SCO1/2